MPRLLSAITTSSTARRQRATAAERLTVTVTQSVKDTAGHRRHQCPRGQAITSQVTTHVNHDIVLRSRSCHSIDPSMPLSSISLLLWRCLLVSLLLLAAVHDDLHPSLVAAHTAEEWKTRSIYQLLTDRFSLPNSSTAPCRDHNDYCGGTYSGVLQHLDYIADLGFSAIWISPVPKNYPRCYHGFSAVDLYTLNPHFGTEAELKALIAECHRRDIWVMVVSLHRHALPAAAAAPAGAYCVLSAHAAAVCVCAVIVCAAGCGQSDNSCRCYPPASHSRCFVLTSPAAGCPVRFASRWVITCPRSASTTPA